MTRWIPTMVISILLAVPVMGCGAGEDRGAAEVDSAGEVVAEAEPAVPDIGIRDGLGTHGQRISTDSDSAQAYFDQGLRLSYAFNHPAAVASYWKAATFDPECAMCYWGIAWASGPNINAALTAEGGAVAYRAAQRALELADGVTDRERAYIEAMVVRYGPDPLTGRASQDSAYAEAMAAVADAYPEDADAQVLAAEALMDLSPWNYWNPDGTPRPDTPALLGRLRPVTESLPEHAGACHFYIHAVEKTRPELAIPCAERLAGLMPAAGHIVHMPSHIYIRVGRYADAIEANEGAVHAHGMHAVPAADAGAAEFDQGYGSHNYHFLAFAAQMAGNRGLALESARDLEARVDREMMRDVGALQHYLVTPLRVMVRFGMWEEILAEPAPPEELAYPTGTWRFARGMAYARTDRPDAAEGELTALRSILESGALDGVDIWGLNSAEALLAVGERVLTGEVAAARGDTDAAVASLTEGVELEEALVYDEPPPWFLPVRHVLGAVLVEAGRADEAETVYEESLDRFADNAYALRGLQVALEAQGDEAGAEVVGERLAMAWRVADVELPGSRF